MLVTIKDPISRRARKKWNLSKLVTKIPEDGYIQISYINWSNQPIALANLSLDVYRGEQQTALGASARSAADSASADSSAVPPKPKGAIADELGLQSAGECQPDPGCDYCNMASACYDECRCVTGGEPCLDPVECGICNSASGCYDGCACSGLNCPPVDPCASNPFDCSCNPAYCDPCASNPGSCECNPANCDPCQLDPCACGNCGGDPSPSDDPIKVTKMPNTISKQVGPNLCVPTIMDAVLKYLCGTDNDNLNRINNYYHDQFGKWAVLQGVDLSDVQSLTQHYLSIKTSYSTVIDALKAGYPVMIGLKNDDNSGHNVLVTGYDPTTQQYIYLDPLTGGEVKTSESVLSNNYYALPVGCL